jgi:hypothetical protein
MPIHENGNRYKIREKSALANKSLVPPGQGLQVSLVEGTQKMLKRPVRHPLPLLTADQI